MNQKDREKQLKKRIKIGIVILMAGAAIVFAPAILWKRQELRVQSVWAQDAMTAAEFVAAKRLSDRMRMCQHSNVASVLGI